MTIGPLTDLRIIDVTATMAGAYGARLLADLGAEVLRPSGARGFYKRLHKGREVADWDPGLHHVLNANKSFVALDLEADADIQGFRDLLTKADLLIEDVGLLSSDDSPLKWPALHSLAPRLSVLSVSPFGATGPYSAYPASDLSIWAWSGMAWTTPGIPDTTTDLLNEPPLAPTGVSLPSIIAGAVTAVSALATLFSGAQKGSRIEVSELEAVVALNYHPVAQYEYLRRLWARGPNIIARQPNCYIPCKDGWLVLVAMSPQHWGELLKAMGSPDWAGSEDFSEAPLRAANWDVLEVLLTEWTNAHTGREITEMLQARGLPVYWSATLKEALASEQVASRDFLQHTADSQGRDVPYPGVPFILSDFPRSASNKPGPETPQPSQTSETRSSKRSPRQPLEGLRVIDFGQYIAVPFSARWLAALGADVIQVESRHNPFDYRNVPPFADNERGLNRAAGYNVLNAGKRSVSLNLRTEEGRDIARHIAAQSDVLMENYSTGTMERWGLGYEDLSALNPRLVYTSVAAFGRTGPLKDYGGLHSIVNAFSGLADVTGYPGGHPRLLGSYFPDVVSATYATLGTLAALHHRDRTGRGQYIDLAMTECLMTLLPEPILAAATDGYEPGRNGSLHPYHVPHNVYPCSGDDQWVAIAVRTDDEWQALCTALGNYLSKDSRYETVAGRKANETELDESIMTWTRRRTKREAVAALLRAGVPAAPVQDPRDLVDDPHIVDRGFIAHVDHPEVGLRRTASVPWRVDGAIVGRQRPAPLVNQHTHSILSDLLGMTAQEIKDLSEAGVLT